MKTYVTAANTIKMTHLKPAVYMTKVACRTAGFFHPIGAF